MMCCVERDGLLAYELVGLFPMGLLAMVFPAVFFFVFMQELV